MMLCMPQVELDGEACNVQGSSVPVRGGKDNKAACRGGIATLKNVQLDTQSAGAYTIRCKTGLESTAALATPCHSNSSPRQHTKTPYLSCLCRRCRRCAVR